jgi:hypothetical protein
MASRDFPKIIGLSGKMGSGKDTSATILQELISNEISYTYEYEIVTFARKVREVVAVLSGISPEIASTTEGKNTPVFSGSGHEMTCGKLQQLIGNGLRELIFSDIWIYLAINNINSSNDGQRIIITDVRYPNEVEYIQSHGGIVIRLNGDPGNVRKLNLTGRDLSAPSETGLDDYPIDKFDAVIDNDGTLDQLRQKLFEIFTSKQIDH